MNFKGLRLVGVFWFLNAASFSLSAGIDMPSKRQDLCTSFLKSVNGILGAQAENGIQMKFVPSNEAVNMLNLFKREVLKVDADGKLVEVDSHSGSFFGSKRLIASRIKGIEDFHWGRVSSSDDAVENLAAFKIDDPVSIINFMEKIVDAKVELSWPRLVGSMISSCPGSVLGIGILSVGSAYFRDGFSIEVLARGLVFAGMIGLNGSYYFNNEYSFDFEKLKNRIIKQIQKSENNKWSFFTVFRQYGNPETGKIEQVLAFDILFRIANGKPQLLVVNTQSTEFPKFPKRPGNSRKRESSGIRSWIPGFAGSR